MNLQKNLYYKLYLARAAELAIIKYYFEDDMKTPMHMSYGQEISPVGVCQALQKNDQVFSTYRSHALYLSKSGNLEKFFGEMYGKVNGIVCGKAGSMHMSDPKNGFMGSSAIVASSIPVAVGAAFAQKYKNTGNISCTFFGDGAIDEGNFWESVNIAASKKLPILFVLEHNKFAVNTPPSMRQGYDSIVNIMKQYDFAAVEEIDAVNNPDVENVYEKSLYVKTKIQDNGKPGFLCIHLERGLEHVGVRPDYDGIRRIKPDAEDPVEFYRRKLLTLLDKKEIKEMEDEINHNVENAVLKAKNAKFPEKEELYKGVFA